MTTQTTAPQVSYRKLTSIVLPDDYKRPDPDPEEVSRHEHANWPPANRRT